MAKLNKHNTQTEEKFEVLIENYNRDTKKYELGKQEKTTLNLKKLEELLRILPTKYSTSPYVDLDDPYSDVFIENGITEKVVELLGESEEIYDYGFHARVITKDFIIWRIDSDKCECLKSYYKWFILKIPFFRKDEFKIEDLAEFFAKQEKKKSLITLINFIVPFVFPSILLFLFFLVFNYYIYKYGFNLYFMIVWLWLVFLAIINLFYSLVFHFKKSKIEYYTPLLSQFKPYNLSNFIILLVLCSSIIYFGILFLIFGYTGDESGLPEPFPETVNLIFGITVSRELAIIIAIICFVGLMIYLLIALKRIAFPLITASFQIVYIYNKFNKAKKLYILHYLNRYLQEEDIKWSEKNYYLQLIIEIDKIAINNTGFFTKLVAIFTFLISIIPPFLIPLFL